MGGHQYDREELRAKERRPEGDSAKLKLTTRAVRNCGRDAAGTP